MAERSRTRRNTLERRCLPQDVQAHVRRRAEGHFQDAGEDQEGLTHCIAATEGAALRPFCLARRGRALSATRGRNRAVDAAVVTIHALRLLQPADRRAETDLPRERCDRVDRSAAGRFARRRGRRRSRRIARR